MNIKILWWKYNMFILIAYDVNITSEGGKTRLRKIAKECVNYGQRVQNSLFEVYIDYKEFIKLRNKLIKIMDQTKDSLRIYHFSYDWRKKIEHIGTKKSYDPEELFFV